MKSELEQFVERIVRHFRGDVTIILFGSRAKGDFNRASDYDLIVISKKLNGDPLRKTKVLYQLNEEFLNVDILAYTPSEFIKALENLSPSALDAMENGIVLHDNGFYRIAKRKFEELKRRGLKKERYWVMRA